MPAVLAELRVDLVLRPALRAELPSDTGRWCAGRRGLAQTLDELALDLFAIAGTGVEALHQARRAGTQTRRHLLPVGVRQLPHRLVEFEFFDRAEGQVLLALEGCARPLADHHRAIVVSRQKGPQRPQRGDAHEA